MTNKEAFILVANWDIPEGDRGKNSSHSVVVFNSTGEIQAVYRYKWRPRETEQQAIMVQHPGCWYILTEAGSCQLERTMNRAIRKRLREANEPTRQP